MSTWTSERVRAGLAAAVGAAAMGLSGCLADSGRDAPAAQPVAGGAVVVAGPEGFCVDPTATRTRPSGAFVLLGACAALNGAGALPPHPAALTAAVSPPGEAPAVADTAGILGAFLSTPQGRALLARDGSAASVEVLETQLQDGTLFVRLRDTSPFDGADVAQDYWRAILDIGPHVVTLSVLPLAERPLDTAEGRALLDGFIAATLAATAAARPARARPAPPRPPAEDAIPGRAASPPAPRP